MGVEQMVNYQLNKAPRLKKVVKRVYQRSMYAVSPKVRYEGKLARVSPNEKNREFFFGYYDKSPWDSSDRYLLCVSARDTWSQPSPRETADILLIDTKLPRAHAGRVKKIAQTSAWNVQQSCMLQWLGPDFSSRVLYNDCRNGQYVSVVLDIQSGKERVVPAAVYTVAGDGKTALTLDFSRLYNLRPGYGYYNVPEATEGVALPDATAVWKVDLERGEVSGLLTYKDFARFQPRPEMLRPGAVHKVNHLMLSPDGKRFAVLYRWFVGRRKYTRLLTCNVDGTGLYNLSDDDMVSHCCWKDEKTILAFANKKDGGPGYYLMEDRSQAYVRCWPQIAGDGHPSYSPDREWVVFDSYPDRARMQEVRIAKDTDVQGRSVKVLARVFSPFRYDNDTRCDLHPRWNHAGDRVCFDGVFEGRRGMYTVSVDHSCNRVAETERKKRIGGMPAVSIGHNDNRSYSTQKLVTKHSVKYSVITPAYNSFHLMRRYFRSLESQTYDNFEVIIVDDGSDDGTYEKLRRYAQSSNLALSVYRTKENLGPGNARNIGMEHARGEWVTFIDSDDWVAKEFFQEIDHVLSHTDAGCVIFDYYVTDGRKKKACASMYKAKEGMVSLSDCMIYTRNHTVGKVYNLSECRKKGITFPCLRKGEDVAFVMRAVEACARPYYRNKPLYYYLQRDRSLSNKAGLDETDVVKAFEILEQTLGDRYEAQLAEKSVSDLLYGVVLIMCKSRKQRGEILAYIDRYERKYPCWHSSNMIRHLGRYKRIFLWFVKKRRVLALRCLAALHSFLLSAASLGMHRP